jgi:hypothetical protein
MNNDKIFFEKSFKNLKNPFNFAFKTIFGLLDKSICEVLVCAPEVLEDERTNCQETKF